MTDHEAREMAREVRCWWCMMPCETGMCDFCEPLFRDISRSPLLARRMVEAVEGGLRLSRRQESW